MVQQQVLLTHHREDVVKFLGLDCPLIEQMLL